MAFDVPLNRWRAQTNAQLLQNSALDEFQPQFFRGANLVVELNALGARIIRRRRNRCLR
jgi:hypothetical protein